MEPKKLILVLGGLAVAGAVALILVFGTGPTGRATGSKARAAGTETLRQELWNDLSAYEGSYLSAYADYFQSGDKDPLELLAAFNELAYKVTGAGGIWRDTVPNKYFGCEANEDFEVCVEFRKAEADLARWDSFQQAAGEVDSGFQASHFILRHGDEMREYLRTYVPASDSLSAVQATPFFSSRFAPSLGI
jgi:hypothetical protein